MADVRKFLTNYTALVVADLVSRVAAFAAMVHIARVLGREFFGFLGFATAFTAYFELLARQGLDTFGIREVARHPSLARQWTDTLLGLRLTTSVIAALALGITVWRLSKPGEVKLLIMLGALMFFTAAVSPQWVFQAVEEMKFAAAARILATLVFALLVLSLLHVSGQFAYVPVFQFCGEAVAVIGLLWIFRRRYGFPRPAFAFRSWGRAFRESVPIALEGVCGVVSFNFDILMLGFWRPASEVGEYSAAYKFINFFSAFVFLFGANLLPLLSRSRSNPSRLRQVSDESLKYACLLVLPLAAGGAILADDIIRLIFGSQFAAAAGALRILIWVIPLAACRVVFRNMLVSQGLQRDLMVCAFFAAATNVCLNLLLIPRYTYIGSAIAMVCSEGILLLLVWRRVAQKVAALRLLPHLWKPALACLPMVLLVARLETTSLLTRIVAGVAIYFLTARICRAFTVADVGKAFAQHDAPQEDIPSKVE